MATNHTQNYNLNLWEPTDRFLRTEFNENSEKLDAALKAEADARTAGDAALAQTVNTKADASALNALAQTVNDKADTSDLTALSETVAKKAASTDLTNRPQMAVGTYTGTGRYGSGDKCQLSFTNTFGKKPKLVIVVGYSASSARLLFIGPQYDSVLYSVGTTQGKVRTSWWNSRLEWYSEESAEYQLNSKDVTYTYFAFV